MIISDEQVRLACEYLHHNSGQPAFPIHPHVAASPELVERVRVSLAGIPETRHDRVEEARAMMATDAPSCDVIAQKMIGRIISDSIR
jgi:hypothetical protein